MAAALLVLTGAASALAHPIGTTNPDGALYTHHGPHYPGLPDLSADPVDGERIQTYDFGDGRGPRQLLRFNGYIANAGTAGTMEVSGTGRAGNEMQTVVQRIWDTADGGTTASDEPLPGARMIFETSDGHNHWHLRDAARYSLVRPDGSNAVPAAKVGFCLMDSENLYDLGRSSYIQPQWAWQDPDDNPEGHGNCAEGNTEAAGVAMGITPGWRDLYEWDVWFQWVDTSTTQPGEYEIRSKVDPSDSILESDENDPAVDKAVTLPGYVATSAAHGSLPRTRPSTITLTKDTFTGPLRPALDPPRFRIDQAPTHGTLNVPVGTWFSGDAVVYKPTSPNADGTDDFRFSVRESTSAFPLNPASATVALQLAAPSSADDPAEQVTIAGAPDMALTGTTVQLSGQVVNPHGDGTLTWSVDGVVGGDAASGTISQSGLYRAPDRVPASGVVTIRATSDMGTFAAVPLRLSAPAPREPAPTDPGPQGAPLGLPIPVPEPAVPTKPVTKATPTIASLRALRIGRYITVSLVPGRVGVIRTDLMRGRRRLARCSSKVSAGRPYTCRITLPRTYKGRLTVRVALRRPHARPVVRRAVVRAGHHPD